MGKASRARSAGRRPDGTLRRARAEFVAPDYEHLQVATIVTEKTFKTGEPEYVVLNRRVRRFSARSSAVARLWSGEALVASLSPIKRVSGGRTR